MTKTDKLKANNDLPEWHNFAVQIRERLFPTAGTTETGEVSQTASLTEGEQEFVEDYQAFWLDHRPENGQATVAPSISDQAAEKGADTSPKVKFDVETAILLGRMAETFHVASAAFLNATEPGRITVIEAGDAQATAQAVQMVQRGFFPAQRAESGQLAEGLLPGYLAVLAPDTADGIVSDSSRKIFLSRVAKALKSQHPLLLVVPSMADLSPDLRQILGKPICLAPASTEIILFALSLTHSVLDKAMRVALRKELPGDAQIRGASLEKILVAFREPTALRVAQKLAQAQGSTAKRPGIEALAGSEELEAVAHQIVNDLKAYAGGELNWADIPHGLILVGPPGTGKTYSIGCIAESTGASLIEATVGGWQAHGHLGDMLRAMRADFSRAKSMKPCIFFIDEIDGFGSRQSSDSHGGSYRRQVINEFLSLMDGASGTEGVLIIGATNHFAALDQALVRPGRFDRVIQIGLPGQNALEQQVRRHLGQDIAEADIPMLAKSFRGRTPADVAATARLARASARSQGAALEVRHVVDLLKANVAKSSDRDRIVALHEAGHAIVADVLRLGNVQELRLTEEGGLTLLRMNPSTDRLSALMARLAYQLGGFAAEQLIFGETSAGSGGQVDSDLAKATTLALMIERSSGLGLNRLVWEPAMMSDGCRPMAPDERKLVQCRLEAALSKATEVLQANKPCLLSLAAAFLDQRHMKAGEIGPHLPTNTKVKMHSEPIPIQTALPLDTTSFLEDFLS